MEIKAHTTLRIIAASCLMFASGSAALAQPAEAHRADWLYRAKWGVFCHYTASQVGWRKKMTAEEWKKTITAPDFNQMYQQISALPPIEMSSEEWNGIVDSFDVEALARQLQEIGAGYFVITIGQNSGHYCAPSAAYDKYVGVKPSKCSRRDLVADLYEALEPRGIKLMVYSSGMAPMEDAAAIKGLKWEKGNVRNSEFLMRWQEVIREWSLRWGNKVMGWWFDGCGGDDALFFAPDAPNFTSFAAAARAGNPDSILAFSHQNIGISRTCPEEDYTGGEVNDPLTVKCTGRWVDGDQWHMLSYLGLWWYFADKPRFADEQVIDISRDIVQEGGVVTWDVTITPDGRIPEAFANQLKAIGKALKDTKRGM